MCTRPPDGVVRMALKEMERKKHVIIIGAGVGGVALAARLAKAGLDVTVVEKNDFIGGRCSIINHQGHRFDQGPSLLLMPELFRETFADLDTSMEAEGVQLVKCEPNYRIQFHDGESISLSTDLSMMKRQIEKWEGADGFEGYLGFLKESHRHYELSLEQVLHQNFTSILSLLRPRLLSTLFSLHPFQSLHFRVSKYFDSLRLRQTFTFASMYMGMSPFEAPGTYSLLQYAEFVQGIWYPRGGFATIPITLSSIAERYGATFRLSSPVKSILVSEDKSKAIGVVTASGEIIEADIVVNNADLIYAHNELLPPERSASNKLYQLLDELNPLSFSRKNLLKRPTSCSTISFYWALSRRLPRPPKDAEQTNPSAKYFSAHNIFLAEAYRPSFDQIFKQHSMPIEPSFYVNVPSMLDKSAAPPDGETVVVLVPVGHLTRDVNQEDRITVKRMVDRARAQVLQTIKSRMGIDLSVDGWIKHELVNDPIVWKEKFNLDRGAILGLSHNIFNILSFRPRTQHPTIKNMYFVGASTHPGTGVPIVLAGAKITAEQILTHLARPTPWKNLPKPNGVSGFHKVRVELSFARFSWLVGWLCIWTSMIIVAYREWFLW